MNEYRDIQASLLRFASDFAQELNDFGGSVQAINLDSFATPQAWPEGDFVGPAEVMIELDESMVTVIMALVISTRDDTNLMRMSDYVNRALNRLRVGTKIPIYDALAGTPRGNLVVKGRVRVSVVENTDSQPAKPIMIQLGSDQTFRVT